MRAPCLPAEPAAGTKLEIEVVSHSMCMCGIYISYSTLCYIAITISIVIGIDIGYMPML